MADTEAKASVFQDDNGNSSYMRVMSGASFVACVAVAASLMIRPPEDPYTGLYIFTAFLVGAFVPKMIQKFAEQPLNMVKK